MRYRYEQIETFIQNRTDAPIYITLFPKEDIDGLYRPCERCSPHKNTEFNLNPNSYYRDGLLFYTEDLSIEPHTLISKIFDSIHIRMSDAIIKFTHDTVMGYSENIFTENFTWIFRYEDSGGLLFKKYRDQYYCYIFEILEEKIILTNKNQ